LSAKIIDGKKIAAEIRKEISETVKQKNILPGLAVLLVGNDPASQIYVRNKEKAAREVGFFSQVFTLPEETSEKEVLEKIKDWNNDPKIHGILVQLPLPKQINSEKIILAIDPKKDVDGFHPINIGKVFAGLEGGIIPCTPASCLKILELQNYDLTGKTAIVLGRSNLVGKPLSLLLTQKNATVTLCHSKTLNLKQITGKADLLIAAIGKAKFVTEEMIKPGAFIIDVGINRVDGKLYGDVDFDNVKEKAGFITPVPGGVGPMTIAHLLKNTLNVCLRI